MIQEVVGGSNGSPTYGANVTNRVRMYSADASTTQTGAATTNPVVIPSGAGYQYSYWKGVCLAISGTFTSVTNIRHYSAGNVASTWTMGTGGQLLRGTMSSGDIGVAAASYVVAIGTSGTTGNYMGSANPNGHPYYNAQATPVANVDNDTSGASALIDSTSITSAGYSKMIVLQVQVANSATQGTMTAVTLTWQYDES